MFNTALSPTCYRGLRSLLVLVQWQTGVRAISNATPMESSIASPIGYTEMVCSGVCVCWDAEIVEHMRTATLTAGVGFHTGVCDNARTHTYKVCHCAVALVAGRRCAVAAFAQGGLSPSANRRNAHCTLYMRTQHSPQAQVRVCRQRRRCESIVFYEMNIILPSAKYIVLQQQSSRTHLHAYTHTHITRTGTGTQMKSNGSLLGMAARTRPDSDIRRRMYDCDDVGLAA